MTRARGVPVSASARDKMSRASTVRDISKYVIARSEGKTLAEIGKENGVSRQAVFQVLLKAKERGLMSDSVKIDHVMAELVRHLKETVKDLERGNPIRRFEDNLLRFQVVSRAMDCRTIGGNDDLIKEIMAGSPT